MTFRRRALAVALLALTPLGAPAAARAEAAVETAHRLYRELEAINDKEIRPQIERVSAQLGTTATLRASLEEYAAPGKDGRPKFLANLGDSESQADKRHIQCDEAAKSLRSLGDALNQLTALYNGIPTSFPASDPTFNLVSSAEQLAQQTDRLGDAITAVEKIAGEAVAGARSVAALNESFEQLKGTHSTLNALVSTYKGEILKLQTMHGALYAARRKAAGTREDALIDLKLMQDQGKVPDEDRENFARYLFQIEALEPEGAVLAGEAQKAVEESDGPAKSFQAAVDKAFDPIENQAADERCAPFQPSGTGRLASLNDLHTRLEAMSLALANQAKPVAERIAYLQAFDQLGRSFVNEMAPRALQKAETENNSDEAVKIRNMASQTQDELQWGKEEAAHLGDASSDLTNAAKRLKAIDNTLAF